MRWLWFVGSLLCFSVVFKTTSIALAALCLIGALVFMVVGTLAVAAQRIDSSRGDAGRLIGPEEIRRMREAEARRTAQQQDEAPAAGSDAGAGGELIGMATATALIAAESADRGTASLVDPTSGDAPGVDTPGGEQGGK